MKLIRREIMAMSLIAIAVLGLFIAFWFLIMPNAQIVEAATISPPTTTTATTKTNPIGTSALKTVTTATTTTTATTATTAANTAATTAKTPTASTSSTGTTTTASTGTVVTTPKVELAVSGLTGADATVTDMHGNPVTPSDDLFSWLDFTVSYNWSIPDDVQINSGDTVPFELPSGLSAHGDLSFPIYDSAGVKIGVASIKAGEATGTITFNDALEQTAKNRHGTLTFVASGTNNGSGNEGENWMFNKNGWIAGYGPDSVPNELTWNIAFNPNEHSLNNVVIIDTLGPNQEYIPGSLTALTGSFDHGNFISDSHSLNPQVTTEGNKVIITFPGTVNTSVDIYYRVKVTGTNPDGTTTWENHATMGSSEGNFEIDSSTSWGGFGTGGGDQKVGSFTLTKVDSVTGNPLAGAEYELKDSKGNVHATNIKTDEKGQITLNNLTYGTYTLTEVKAPDGYTLNPTPIEFTIPNDKVPDVSTVQKDVAETGAVILKKLDPDNKNTIAGAVFNLLDKNGKVVKEGLTTDGNGEISYEDLAPGEYQFIETQPAAGYVANKQPIEFTIVAGQTTPITLEKFNVATTVVSDTGNVVLTKVDATLNKLLPGAVFDLVGSDGKTSVETGLTTNEQGQITVSNLPAGDYYFIETSAPEGYELDETPIKFTVTKDMTNTLEAKDKQVPTEPGVTEPPTTNPGPTEPENPKPPVTNPGPTEPENPKPPVTNPGPTEPEKPKPPVTNPGPTEPENPKPPVTNPGPTEPGKPKPPVTNPGPTEPGKPKPPVTNPGPTEPSKPTPPVTNPSEPAKPSPNPGPSVVYPSTNDKDNSSSIGTMPNANTGIGYGKAKLPQTGNENSLLMILSGFFIALFVLLKHLIKKLA